MTGGDAIPPDSAQADRLPLLDNGKDRSWSQTAPGRRSPWPLRIVTVMVLLFLGGFVGLYFQGPAMRAIFDWTRLEPGAGARQPIALPVDRVPSAERVAAMAVGDVVALGRLQPEGGTVSVALPQGAGDARIDRILVDEGDRVVRGDHPHGSFGLGQDDAADPDGMPARGTCRKRPVAGSRVVRIRRGHADRHAPTSGFVFQAHNLHDSFTARQNVMMGLQVHGRGDPARQIAAADHLLELLGLGERLDYLPGNLSGGQKQRVAIARALVSNPDIIFADEPTAALDKVSGLAAVHLFKDLGRTRGTTTVMVTHDPRILDLADRVVTLEDGRLVKDVAGQGRQTRAFPATPG